MTLTTTPRLAALLTTCALGLAACGGDDEEGGGGGGGTLPKAEFIAQADKICADLDKQTEALGEPTSPEEISDFIGKGLEITRPALEDLRALEARAPEDVKADYAKAMDLLDEQTGLIEQAQAAGSDQAKVQEIFAKIEPIEKESDALAQKIGLKECGNES